MTSPRSDPGVRRDVDLADRRPHLLDRLPVGLWVLLLAVGTVLRSGVAVYRATEPMVEFATTFPEIASDSYKLFSVLPAAVAAAVGVGTPHAWTWLHLGVTAAVFAATLGWAALALRPATRRPLILLLAGSAMPPVLLQKLGHYDVYSFLAGLFLVVPSSISGAVGGVIFALTSFEQGIVALVSLTLVMVALERHVPKHLVVAAVVMLATGTIARLWLRGSGVLPRSGLLDENLLRAFRGFLEAGTTAVWTWYGLSWLVVIAVVYVVVDRGVTPARTVCLLLGLVGVPAAASVTTLDGTRVFAVVAWPALLAALGWLSYQEELATFRTRNVDAGLAGLVALWLVAPALITWKGGDLVSPWGSTPW